MKKLSIVIPARHEEFLEPTINSLFERAETEIEVLVCLDGYWPNPYPKERENLIILHKSEPEGMRAGVNSLVAIASGTHILKSDAHCLFAPGFDSVLLDTCEDDWIVVPRRKRLDPIAWKPEEGERPDVDYTYQSFDAANFGNWRMGLNGKIWNEKNRDESLRAITLDSLMTFQGSAYCLKRDYFHFLELLDEENYHTVANEAEEASLKCWLSKGRVVVQKGIWYAHLHRGNRFPRAYKHDKGAIDRSAAFTRKWITNSAWNEKQTLPFEWWIEKFWPLPGWPDDWREQLHYRALTLR